MSSTHVRDGIAAPLDDDVFARLARLVMERLAATDSDEILTGSTVLFGADSLNLDSLDAFELATSIENEFHIRIGELELYQSRSIGALALLVSSRMSS